MFLAVHVIILGILTLLNFCSMQRTHLFLAFRVKQFLLMQLVLQAVACGSSIVQLNGGLHESSVRLLVGLLPVGVAKGIQLKHKQTLNYRKDKQGFCVKKQTKFYIKC